MPRQGRTPDSSYPCSEGGVLRPTEKLLLEEHQLVTVIPSCKTSVLIGAKILEEYKDDEEDGAFFVVPIIPTVPTPCSSEAYLPWHSGAHYPGGHVREPRGVCAPVVLQRCIFHISGGCDSDA